MCAEIFPLIYLLREVVTGQCDILHYIYSQYTVVTYTLCFCLSKHWHGYLLFIRLATSECFVMNESDRNMYIHLDVPDIQN